MTTVTVVTVRYSSLQLIISRDSPLQFVTTYNQSLQFDNSLQKFIKPWNLNLSRTSCEATNQSFKFQKKGQRTVKPLHSEFDSKTFNQAINAPDAEQWLEAIKDKINQMNTLDA